MIRDFGFNDNSISNQKIFRPIAGNVCAQDIGMVNLLIKHSHVAKNLKKIESVHVTLLEFLLSLTRHQIKTAILIASRKKTCAVKKKRRLLRLDHQGTTVNFRCVLCISSRVISDTRGNFGRSVTAIFKML